MGFEAEPLIDGQGRIVVALDVQVHDAYAGLVEVTQSARRERLAEPAALCLWVDAHDVDLADRAVDLGPMETDDSAVPLSDEQTIGVEPVALSTPLEVRSTHRPLLGVRREGAAVDLDDRVEVVIVSV